LDRVLFAKGAVGRIVRRIQDQLGFVPPRADGWYGDDTHDALVAFQQAHGLPATGDLDTSTWTTLMGVPIPTVEDRSLQLTAHFEGHDFTLAQGNFDGAGITWGIVGFTLKSGEIGSIVQEISDKHPDLLAQAFGSLAEDLVALIKRPWPDQLAFADSISVGKNNVLAEPWLSSFRRLGEISEVQAAQLAHVRVDYMDPAAKTATEWGLTSELGRALAFDIHVQNGGINDTASAKISAALKGKAAPPEADLRTIVANAVADASAAPWREDVRSRKTTIASGVGEVHGWKYTLRNWGLAELPA
jgi:hypothetical protein